MTAPLSPIPAVDLRAIGKRFGQAWVLRGVDLTVRPGTVHALVGENGAGKSTLLRILAGVVARDEGEIRLGGTPVGRYALEQARAAGIGMVHQHFMLVEPLTVAENLVLGREPSRWGLLDVARARAMVLEVSDRYGVPVHPDRPVQDLGIGERQWVEILKVLSSGSRVLLLDEPTAVLTPQEARRLLEMLTRLKADGHTLLLVTHKLDEVMQVADRITVLRNGRKVADVDPTDTDTVALAHLLVGRPVAGPNDSVRARHPASLAGPAAGTPDGGERSPSRPPDPPPVLEVREITLRRGSRLVLDHVSFQVAPGEIVGIAGVMGNGQSEVLEVVAGLCPPTSGRVLLQGRDVTALPVEGRRRAGIAHVPEDRGDRGLVGSFSVADNLLLGAWRGIGHWFHLSRRSLTDRAARIIQEHDIRPPDPDLPVSSLSGGNAQKVVLARETGRGPSLLLAGQPTRGVDVGAVEAIHARLRRLRDHGAGIVLVSADLSEILALSDRVLVIHRGRIVAEVSADGATAESLGEHMTGARPSPIAPSPGDPP